MDNKKRTITADESLNELRKILEQLKDAKLHELHNAIAVTKGQELLDQLERWGDNPYARQALIEAYWDWRREADQIIGDAS